jgi:hypothetical protein
METTSTITQTKPVSQYSRSPKIAESNHKVKRPFGATILVWVVLILASLNWLRFVTVLRGWRFLENLEPALPLPYLALSGLLWGMVGTTLVWGLFLGRRWAPLVIRMAAPLYAAAYWLDRILIADPSAIASRWPFALGLTIILLILTYSVLASSKVRHFYLKPVS